MVVVVTHQINHSSCVGRTKVFGVLDLLAISFCNVLSRKQANKKYDDKKMNTKVDVNRPAPGPDVTTICLIFVIYLVLQTSYSMPAVRHPVMTYGGNADGDPCVFPFNHITYDVADGGWHVHQHQQCTFEDRNHAWCSTKEEYWDGRNSSKWGYCVIENMYAIDANGSQSACVFPFEYNGKSYPGCTDVNHHSGPDSTRDRLWCGTTDNVDQDNQWGYCDVDNETYAESGQKCLLPFSYRGITFSQCTTYDAYPADELRLWCAVSETGEWDYCLVTPRSSTRTEEQKVEEETFGDVGNDDDEAEHTNDVGDVSAIRDQLKGVVWKLWVVLFVALTVFLAVCTAAVFCEFAQCDSRALTSTAESF
ncbi:hypothetical protein LSAT2_005045 [Lamellibrachia satsuma]|nr:hypothetical protein LSAT2_005045 [Lamellibrachia satsuma]